jgi:hypothetical protein
MKQGSITSFMKKKAEGLETPKDSKHGLINNGIQSLENTNIKEKIERSETKIHMDSFSSNKKRRHIVDEDEEEAELCENTASDLLLTSKEAKTEKSNLIY